MRYPFRGRQCVTGGKRNVQLKQVAMQDVSKVAKVCKLERGEGVVRMRGDMCFEGQQSRVKFRDIWSWFDGGEVGDEAVVIRVDVWDGLGANEVGMKNVIGEVGEGATVVTVAWICNGGRVPTIW